VVAIVPVMYVDAKREWNVGENPVMLLLAFFVSGAAAFALDLIFKTHVSVPGMIAALDLTHHVAARPQPLIASVLDYYAVALGPTPWTWLRFLAIHAAMVVVFAAVLFRTTPEEATLEPAPPLKRSLRMLGLSAVAVGASAAVAFPLLVQLMIWVRGLNG
jgi:hypothetical protein